MIELGTTALDVLQARLPRQDNVTLVFHVLVVKFNQRERRRHAYHVMKGNIKNFEVEGDATNAKSELFKLTLVNAHAIHANAEK
jgi:hypothetical protein